MEGLSLIGAAEYLIMRSSEFIGDHYEILTVTENRSRRYRPGRGSLSDVSP